ncbi:unnamed protein product, partial [Ilex paraguariensis]
TKKTTLPLPTTNHVLATLEIWGLYSHYNSSLILPQNRSLSLPPNVLLHNTKHPKSNEGFCSRVIFFKKNQTPEQNNKTHDRKAPNTTTTTSFSNKIDPTHETWPDMQDQNYVEQPPPP